MHFATPAKLVRLACLSSEISISLPNHIPDDSAWYLHFDLLIKYAPDHYSFHAFLPLIREQGQEILVRKVTAPIALVEEKEKELGHHTRCELLQIAVIKL